MISKDRQESAPTSPPLSKTRSRSSGSVMSKPALICTPRLLSAPRRALIDYTGAPTSATVAICMAGLVRAFSRSFPLLQRAAPGADIFIHAGIDVGELGWAAAAGQAQLQQACSYEHTQRAVLEETPRCSTYTPEQRTAEQGGRVARCFELIERHAPTTRYKLLVRTRTDLVYPPGPFPFDAVARVVGGRHREWLAIPLCCDFKGLNDQLAVGTPGAMRRYARSPGWATGRRSDVAIKQALAQAPGSRQPPVALKRFWYEYALLRADQLPLFDAVGSTVFARYRHSAALAHFIGASRAEFASTMLRVGSACSFEPQREVAALRRVPPGPSGRHVSRAGATKVATPWRVADLGCSAFEPRACPVAARTVVPVNGSLEACAAALQAG